MQNQEKPVAPVAHRDGNNTRARLLVAPFRCQPAIDFRLGEPLGHSLEVLRTQTFKSDGFTGTVGLDGFQILLSNELAIAGRRIQTD